MATIRKGNKDDQIEGTADSDVIYANGGNDVIWPWQGDDTVNAGPGNDVVVVYSGNDDVYGGSGWDLLSFYYATKGVTLNLASGRVEFVAGGTGKTTFTGIEGAYGSKFGDDISGNQGANSLFAMEGDDRIDGRGGDDVINGFTGKDKMFGGSGDDRVVVAPGPDSFDGGDGVDTIDFYFDKNGVDVSLEAGSADFQSKAGTGKLTFVNVENIYGSLKDDTLEGDDGANLLGGSDGDDLLLGNGGDDMLGGAVGSDTMTGGSGLDGFILGASGKGDLDVVTDFDVTDDSLYIVKAYYDVAGPGAPVEAGGFKFKALADNQFESNASGAASTNDIRLIYETDTGILWYDENGAKSGKRTALAQFEDEPGLTVEDFFVLL